MKHPQASLVFDDWPILVLPQLAAKIGLNEAILFQKLHYWLGRSTKARDGVKYVYKTTKEWAEEFPFWSEATIKRIGARLRELGLVVVVKESDTSWNRTNWYTIDYTVLNRIGSISDGALVQIDPMHALNLTESNGSDCAVRSAQVAPITSTKTTSKTTAETNPLRPLSADQFEKAFAQLPKRAGNNPRRAAVHAWNARMREKVDPEVITAGAQRYAAFCMATGKVGTEKVMMAKTFFGPDRSYEQDFGVPASTDVKVAGKQWWETASGIQKKADELGLTWGGDPNVESFPAFGKRVRALAESAVHQ